MLKPLSINPIQFCYLHTIFSCQIPAVTSQDRTTFTIVCHHNKQLLILRNISIDFHSLKPSLSHNDPLHIQPVNFRPLQKIETMTRSPRGTFIATLGPGGEVTLWRLRRYRDQVLGAEAFTQYHPNINANEKRSGLRPLKLAIWDDGERIVYYSKDDLHLLRRTVSPNGVTYEITNNFNLPCDEPSFPSGPVKVLMPLTKKSENGRSNYFLLAAYETGHIFFWSIEAAENKGHDKITLENHLNVNKGCEEPLQAVFAIDDALGDVDPDAIRVNVGCISSEGVINFWSRNLGYDGTLMWTSRGTVHTNKKNIRVAKASGTKKVAICKHKCFTML